MKYLKVSQQLELLKNKEYDKLYEYAQEHNLNHGVVKALISELKELAEKQKAPSSIH